MDEAQQSTMRDTQMTGGCNGREVSKIHTRTHHGESVSEWSQIAWFNDGGMVAVEGRVEVDKLKAGSRGRLTVVGRMR